MVKGAVQLPSFRPIPDVAWTLELIDAHTVNLLLDPGSPEMTVYQLPALKEIFSQALPVTCTPIVGGFELTYTPTFVLPRAFILPSADPGIRTDLGNYLVGNRVQVTNFGAPPVELSTLTPTYQSLSGSTITLLTGSSPGGVFVCSPLQWANTTQGNTATTMATDGYTMDITFPFPPASGDEIVYLDTALASNAFSNPQLGAYQFTIP